MDELYFCGDFNDSISIEEKRLIPHIKRFFECAVGDPVFYAAVKENAAGCGPLLESRGIYGVDPVQVAALVPELPALKEVSPEELADKPQALLWKRWTEATARFRKNWRKRSEKTPSNRFNAWHRRQANRCHSQLGKETNQEIVHATMVFELSKGCSMGCSFCGLAAEPLQGIYRYTEGNARLWQDILQVAVERLGTTAGTGVCYWATEPSDNPDYLKFIKDYGEITGTYPQTTTAAPLLNLTWTNDLLKFRRKHITSVDRFSILSLDMLRRVHDTFSAEDLAWTELILQHSDSLVQLMANSGRNRSKAIPESPQLDIVRDHTIACLTGYLINMVERSVRLISPCPPSDRWPLGYRIHAEGRFYTAVELDKFIDETIEKCMPEHVASGDVLAFRRDLEFTSLPQGFQLRSEHQLHKMQGASHLAPLGRLIAHGDLSSSNVMDKLLAQHTDILAIMSSIQRLFDQGLLEDGLGDERPQIEVRSNDLCNEECC